jgi:hypothetical protein
MTKGKPKDKPPQIDNAVSEQTGQYDMRFLLWRQFCSQNNIAVETLPSQLDEAQKDKWEALKADRLRGRTQK